MVAKCNIATIIFLLFISLGTQLTLGARWEPSSLHTFLLFEEFTNAP